MALIYNSDQTDVIRVAEKIRKEFLQLPLISGHTISISIGVAGLQAEMDWKQWMKLGDENLYKAKDNGRNQVVA
jgi:diguanylate cyclase (GGDEF)-like protein